MLQNHTPASLPGLASYLVSVDLLTLPIAQEAWEKALKNKLHFITYIVEQKLICSEKIVNSCIKTFGFDTFNLDEYDTSWLHNLPVNSELIIRYHLIPLYKKNNTLYVGISDPTDRSALDTLAFHTNSRVQAVIVAEDKLNYLLNKYFKSSSINPNLELNLIQQIFNEEKPLTLNENTINYDEPLIRFVDNILQHAIQQSASDIHIEPFETICRIRYRQDGLLRETAEIPAMLAIRLTSRLKILAKLDISEKRLPQDGRFQSGTRDIRINTCPTLFGEKIVLRILNPENLTRNLSTLGFTATQLITFTAAISQPQGMILITGPTGSGKTVTLYTALDFLNTPEKNISTVEDPVEIQLKGINQINIHPKIGLHFSTILRTLLRQDPDIIMVGEIRDAETAEIAIQAAQTGHLVFSTLHTNNAYDAIIRLQSMGIPNYNIACSVSLIVAQRLVRKLCESCKHPDSISPATLLSINFPPALLPCIIYSAVGCQHCFQGYHGRIGIYELLPINNQDLTTTTVETSLKYAGFEKVAQGITTLIEINRVIQMFSTTMECK